MSPVGSNDFRILILWSMIQIFGEWRALLRTKISYLNERSTLNIYQIYLTDSLTRKLFKNIC